MIPENSNFYSSVKSFVNNNKVLSGVTLGIAVAIYAIGILAGRAVAWIAECTGITQKTDSIARKILNNTQSAKQDMVIEDIKVSSQAQTDIPMTLQADTNPPLPKIINWCDANSQILDQVQKMWRRRRANFIKHVPDEDKMMCIIEGDRLIGCVALEKYSITKPASLVQIVGSQKVYKLDIQIHNDYQGKGYGRELFNSACNLAINEGAFIFLVDMADKGVGDRLYGGEKTRQLFDVYHVLKSTRGQYLLGKKTQTSNRLNYLKIDQDENFVFLQAVESLEGMKHVINYLETHQEDVSLINASIISTCDDTIGMYKSLWTNDQLAQYNACLDKLRLALGESI
jgi:GNAT superfamily N-acetyltransferase